MKLEIPFGDTNFPRWDDIELSESFLISSMHEEAASYTSTILEALCHTGIQNNEEGGLEIFHMMESAGIVLVQAFYHLGRASSILNKLKSLFGFVEAIPVQVLFVGACLQKSAGDSSNVSIFLKEFIDKWSFADGRYFILDFSKTGTTLFDRHHRCYKLVDDDYMKLVELYVETLLDMHPNDSDIAVSWIEGCPLHENGKAELLRKVRSSCPDTDTETPHSSPLTSTENKELPSSTSRAVLQPFDMVKAEPNNGSKAATEGTVPNLTRRIGICFSCFNFTNSKLGHYFVALSDGKIMLGFFVLFGLYVLRRKKRTLSRLLLKASSSTRKAIGEVWELVFSHQVNPFAIAQPASQLASW